MRLDVGPLGRRAVGRWLLTVFQDPVIQKVTGKTEPSEVISALRELKNNFK